VVMDEGQQPNQSQTPGSLEDPRSNEVLNPGS